MQSESHSHSGSTLSSLTMTRVIQDKKEIIQPEKKLSNEHLQKQQSFQKAMLFDFMNSNQEEHNNSIGSENLEMDVKESFDVEDAPSLAASDVDSNVDDMTMNTYALVGGRDIKNPPQVLITNADGKSERWWSEGSARVSPLVFEGPTKDVKKDKVIDTKQQYGNNVGPTVIGSGRQDYILDQVIETESQTGTFCLEGLCSEDLSTLFDSTCSVLCPTYGAFKMPENHDLSLMVEFDEELKSLDRRHKMEELHDIDDEKGVVDEDERQVSLFDMLVDKNSKPEDIMRYLVEHPEAVQEIREADGRLPLHALCDTSLEDSLLFTHPVGLEIDDTITYCIKEISRHRMLIKLITWSYIGACAQPDTKGDLPSHLLGRRLIEWMISLQRFMTQSQLNITNYERITTLSKIISESIEVVLRPLSLNKGACMSQGSYQSAIPLHLSILFGGTIDIFRLILETYPNGALIPFIFEGRSVLPIELLEVIRNDQKSMYSVMSGSRKLERITLLWNATIPNSSYEEDILTRMDLLFCFNPLSSLVEDKDRSNRIVNLIRTEAKQDRGLWKESVSPSIKSIWMWICTRDDEVYAIYVEMIVKNLNEISFQKLARVQTHSGASIIDIAAPSVKNVLLKEQARFERIPTVQADENDSFGDIHQEQNRSNEADDESTGSHQIAATASKSIFGIKVDAIPVSFIVFPFPLDHSEGKDGVLVAERHAQLAVKFANWMMNATSPEMINICLQNKIDEKRNAYGSRSRRNLPLEREKSTISSLYRKGGYFYFIDEEKGTPVVDAEEGWNYPIFISGASQIETLLPLMRLGMVLMRKSKSISVLSQVVVDRMENEYNSDYPVSWVSAVQDLIRYYDDEQLNAKDSILVQNKRHMQNRLLQFLSLPSSNLFLDPSEYEGLDWSTEISLLMLIVENRGFTVSSLLSTLGLKRRKVSSSNTDIVWTKGDDQDDIYHDSRDELEDILNQDDDDDDDIECLFKEPKTNIDKEYSKPHSYEIGRNRNPMTTKSHKNHFADEDLDNKISEMNNFLAMNYEEDELLDSKLHFSSDGSNDESSSTDSSFRTCKESENEDSSDYDESSSASSSKLFGSAYLMNELNSNK